MNEWERRVAEVNQNHSDLWSIAKSLSANPIIEYFGYTLQIGSVTGGFLAKDVAQQGTIIVQADAYFVLQYISTCVIRTDLQTVCQDSRGINIQITDTGAGGILYNQAFDAGLMTGTPGANFYKGADAYKQYQSGIPFIFPIPRVILPHTNIKIEATQTLTQAGGTETELFFVSLMGARVTQG